MHAPRMHEVDAETQELNRAYVLDSLRRPSAQMLREQREQAETLAPGDLHHDDIDTTALNVACVDDEDLQATQYLPPSQRFPPPPSQNLQQPRTYPSPIQPMQVPMHQMHAVPTPPTPMQPRTVEHALRDQIMTGLGPGQQPPPPPHYPPPGGYPSSSNAVPTHPLSGPEVSARVTGPGNAPPPMSARVTGPGLPSSPRTTAPGVARTTGTNMAAPPSQPWPPVVSHQSQQTHGHDPWSSVPGTNPSTIDRRPEEARMPVGYVVASAFFLVIALVGFGLWLGFAVISL